MSEPITPEDTVPEPDTTEPTNPDNAPEPTKPPTPEPDVTNPDEVPQSSCRVVLLDKSLLQEWRDSTSEYQELVTKPLGRIEAKELVKCAQPIWESALTEWTVLAFWATCLTAISWLLVVLAGGATDLAGLALITVIVPVVALLLFNLVWFGVVKKKGCMPCAMFCFTGDAVVLVWGIICLVLLVANVGMAFSGLVGVVGQGTLVIVAEAVRSCVLVLNAVVLAYMAICCYRVWRGDSQAGGESAAEGDVEAGGGKEDVVVLEGEARAVNCGC